MAHDFTRRHFFFGTLLAGAVPSGGFGSTASLKTLGYKSPNEKLNIASIGAGGKASSDIDGCATENIVALCDVDEKKANKFRDQKFKDAPKYKDFRKMLDKEKDIYAVIVAIPDHMHATAAHWAMERGKHVYCQKPLTRTIWEARQLQEAANKYKVATQMGNQGYSNEGTRQVAEMIWSGEIDRHRRRGECLRRRPRTTRRANGPSARCGAAGSARPLHAAGVGRRGYACQSRKAHRDRRAGAGHRRSSHL